MSTAFGSFRDKVVLVTGASRGIGAATAAVFAGQGASVLVNHPATDAAQHRAAIADWRRQGNFDEQQVVALEADVSDPAQVAAMFEQIGKLDILVNNAGINQDRTVAKMTNDQWRRVLQVNLEGPFFCCRNAIPRLRDGGRIVNLSSVVARTGSFGAANYAASKAGVLALTKTLALELARRGITVNAVSPGFIDTAMTSSIPAEVLQRLLERIPLGRKGAAAEVANCVLFLASASAAYITGQSLGVNGGFYMGDG